MSDATPTTSHHSALSTFSVAAEIVLPLPPRDIWPHLTGPGRLPGEILAAEEEARILFRHEGTAGWLPIEAPRAEYRLEPSPAGTRLALEATAHARPDDVEFVKKRLQGWVDGSVAAFRSLSVRRAA